MKNKLLLPLGALAAIAGVALLGSKEKTSVAPTVPPSKGETWKIIFGVHPDIESQAEFAEFEKIAAYTGPQAGLNIIELDRPAPNTLEMTVKYLTKPNDIPIGSQLTLGKYTVVVTERFKVS